MPIINRLIGRNRTNRDPWSILNKLINSAMKIEMNQASLSMLKVC